MVKVTIYIEREFGNAYNAERALDAVIPKIEAAEWTVKDWDIRK